MTRKTKREIAKLRKRRISDRTADKWTMQRMAVDLGEKDAEIERLKAIIRQLGTSNGYTHAEIDAFFDCRN